MPQTRREFAPEFKRETVALLEASGRLLMQVATEVGIWPSMLRNWLLTEEPDRLGIRARSPSPSARKRRKESRSRIWNSAASSDRL